ncbi:MAG: PDZ domain-containing protein [Acidobacteriota bacterium]
MTGFSAKSTLSAALAGCVLLAGASATLAQDEDVRVIVKKFSGCEGDDCEALAEKAIQIFVDESGATQVLGGGENVWISEDGDIDGKIFLSALGGKGGFLGVQLTELSDELRDHFRVGADGGVMVSKVVDDSAAFRAGLEVGDIVSGVNGEGIGSAGALSRAISSYEAGETVDLEVWRDGRVQTLSATLGESDSRNFVRKVNRQIRIECDDDAGDCDIDGLHELGGLGDHFKVLKIGGGDFDFDCGDDCEIQVQCTDENDCECSVNGEVTDCSELGQ